MSCSPNHSREEKGEEKRREQGRKGKRGK